MRWGVVGRIVPLVLAAWFAAAPPVSAEDAATGHGSTTAATAAPTQFKMTIPTVQVVNSSIDESTLRAILSGDLASHADELATLKATSIRVPEVRMEYALPAPDGTLQQSTTTLRDIRLNKVTNGIAQAVIIGGADTVSNNGTAKFGKISAEDFDIGRMLAFAGLVKGDPTGPRRTVYRKLMTSGGTVVSPEASCTFGPYSVDRVSLRPLKTSFQEAFALLERNAKEKDLSPEDSVTLLAFAADVVDAIETSPFKIGALACKGVDDKGKPIEVSLGGIDVGAFARARYPEIVVRDLDIKVEGDGELSLGEFRFKGFDLSGTLATLKQAEGKIDAQWIEENYRLLLPTFDGFALSKFAMDIPDPDKPGERVKAAIAKFDLTLTDYLNGIPTDVSTSASHIVVDLPEDTSDDNIKLLLAYGLKKFDLGFDVGVKWDEKANEIRLDRFNISGADMGSVAGAVVVGGAVRDLFSTDLLTQAASALTLTFKSAKVNVKDAGLANIIMRAAAADAGKDVETLREAAASFTKGSIRLFLGPAANASKVADAIADFVNGKRSLSVTAKSKDEEGVPLVEFPKLRSDPEALLDKFDIDAVVK
jgi:hypothetical protein